MIISKWIVNNNEYLLGQYNLYEFIETKQGNCSAHSALFRQMCRAVGIENNVVVGHVEGGAHAWNQVKIGSEWYYCDITWADNVIFDMRYILSKELWNTHTAERIYNGICY